MAAPLDAMLLLAPALSERLLDRFRDVAVRVLSLPDPGLELAAEDRWKAGLLGQLPEYSDWVRTGIAEALLLLAAFEHELRVDFSYSMQGWVASVVREILSDADRETWASLGAALPLLAEAAPDAFLEALERTLANSPERLTYLFEQEGDGPMGRCLHAELLWALETVAWSPVHLTRVAVSLAGLARLDPGGRWSNRPATSLVDVFLPWLRHTAASVEERLAAIDVVIDREPEQGWKMLIAMLPQGPGFSSGTHEPRWRDWAQSIERSVTRGEHWRYVIAIGDRVLDLVEGDGSRIADLLEFVVAMPESWGERVIDELSAFADRVESDQAKLPVWAALRKHIGHHGSFPDADWSESEDVLARLSEIYARLEPRDLLLRNRWLFDDHWVQLPFGVEDYAEREDRIRAMRVEAVRAHHETGGVESVLSLAQSVAVPELVGRIAADCDLGGDFEGAILAGTLGVEDDALRSAGRSFVRQRSHQSGEDWMNAIVDRAARQRWTEGLVLDLLVGMPPTASTWSYLSRFESRMARRYWAESLPAFRYEDPRELQTAVEGLSSVERWRDAIALISISDASSQLPARLIGDALVGFASADVGADSGRRLDPYELGKVFEALDGTSDADDSTTAGLEWTFLAILERSERGARCLFNALEQDPGTFAYFVSLVYRSDEERAARENVSEEAQRIAGQARLLLDAWHGLPGLIGQSIDGAVLGQWLDGVLARSDETGHRRSAAFSIGKVLARSPSEGELWPADCVCALIDRLGSEMLDEGFYLGVVNSRGVVARASGGDQERALEERYRVWAQARAASYPRTSAILARIANSYGSDARRWDIDAVIDDMRFD